MASSSAQGAMPDHSTAFLAHAIAGGVAGTSETVAMYPLDTIKTRMQAAGPRGAHGLMSTAVSIMQHEGVRGLYRGMTAASVGAAPAHALYYAVYEWLKARLGGNCAGHRPVAVATAGVAATVLNDAVLTPADVIKQRLQMDSGRYAGVLDCTLKTWRHEGIAAFYRSYPTTLLMNIPWTILHFPLYESAKKVLAPGRQGEEGTLVQLTAGGFAGGVAAALTTPFDVVKTRLQLDEGLHGRSTLNAFSLMRQIARQEGASALWRGLTPRALWHAPAGAVCWASYEAMKRLLGVNIQHQHVELLLLEAAE